MHYIIYFVVFVILISFIRIIFARKTKGLPSDHHGIKIRGKAKDDFYTTYIPSEHIKKKNE
jgi:hypothetical protein